MSETGMSFDVNVSYPNDIDYYYKAELEKIDLDEERKKDIENDRGFLISKARTIKKDLKDPNGIFSTRFGQTLGDLNPFIDRYKCQCGKTRSRIMHGLKCPKCGTRVRYVDDDFSYFGWKVLKEGYWIIHPNDYKKIEFFFGNGVGKKSKLYNIINFIDEQDINGQSSMLESTPKNEPFFGRGILWLQEHFDEVMDYYLEKNPNKKAYYDMIMEPSNRKSVFTHSIPVYTTLLRPVNTKDGTMPYEATNALYNMMNNLVTQINNDKNRSGRAKKPKNQLLCDLQMKYMELYNEIEAILSSKKGKIRTLIGGRYNFSTRAVIVQDPTLRIDQCKLPYISLCILCQQQIINILVKTRNISFDAAYNIWYMALLIPSKEIKDIIYSLIHAKPEGLPLMLGRNPTINYGSLMHIYCVDMTDNFVFSISLRILGPMAADFDGDQENAFMIINEAFNQRAKEIFNPREAMQIDRNDGLFNTDVCIQKDTLVNANTIMNLGRDHYTDEALELIRTIKEQNEKLYY